MHLSVWLYEVAISSLLANDIAYQKVSLKKPTQSQKKIYEST